MAEHLIQSETLTAIADEIRRVTTVADNLTPAQMVTALQNVKSTGELPTAEETTFGTNEVETEYGVTSYSGGSWKSAAATNMEVGIAFTPKEAMAIHGVRFVTNVNTNTDAVKIWGADQTVIQTLTATSVGDYMLDYPINLTVGEEYAITVYRTSYYYYNGTATKNSKLDIRFASVSGSGNYPSGSGSNFLGIDVIIGPAVDGVLPTEYTVQRTTMTSIADEVKRISGESGTLSTSQIITELQEVVTQTKTATPTISEQTISPDDGYYALSSVDGYYGLASVVVSAMESELVDAMEVSFI